MYFQLFVHFEFKIHFLVFSETRRTIMSAKEKQHGCLSSDD